MGTMKRCSTTAVLGFIFLITVYTDVSAQINKTPQLTVGVLKEYRVKTAKELHSYLTKINKFIPTLSPSQREWLEKETPAARLVTERYIQVMKSKEYNMNFVMNFVKEHLDLMLFNLERLHREKSLKREVYLWADLAYELMDYNFWSSVYFYMVKEFLIIPKSFFYPEGTIDSGYEGFYLLNGVVPGQQILRNLIRPFLNEESFD